MTSNEPVAVHPASVGVTCLTDRVRENPAMTRRAALVGSIVVVVALVVAVLAVGLSAKHPARRGRHPPVSRSSVPTASTVTTAPDPRGVPTPRSTGPPDPWAHDPVSLTTIRHGISPLTSGAYLQISAIFAEEASSAEALRGPVERIDGTHLQDGRGSGRGRRPNPRA